MTMTSYLIQEGNAKNSNQFITEIAKKSEKHEGLLMTMAQQIEEIGIQEGIQKGIEEGIQKREKQASMKIARQLLERGMESQSVRQITGLSETEMKSLIQN